MAQRIGPPGSGRIAIAGTHAGKPWANVFWVNLAGGTTAAQAGWDAFVSSYGENYYNVWKDSLSNQTQMLSATGVLFQSATSVLHSVHTMAHPGLVSATYVPDAAACTVISWSSNAYWRGGKPRTYLPGIQESYITGWSQLTQAGDDWYTARAAAYLTAVNALSATGITNTQMGFVHFFSQGVLLNPGVFYPITGSTVHPRYGTQRRRLGRWIP